MNWTDELYNVYENNCGKELDGSVLLPVAHSTANAQIEVMLDDDGEFVKASRVEKSDAVTIIPARERSNGIIPLPFADKLVYIAGDFPRYATGKRADNADYYSAYMKQLESWKDSEFTHPSVQKLYKYLSKGCIIKDLVASGVLVLDENGKLAEKEKIAGIAQQDSFVRFRIGGLESESRTWLDKTLYESFIKYNASVMKEKGLCYATGKITAYTYKHPSKIKNAGDKSKLISSNDESGFTYRGRFKDKEEAFCVGYEYSQKVHNALKWLIANQGKNYGNTTLVVWESTLNPVISTDASFPAYDDEDEDNFADTEEKYMSQLNKMIMGHKEELDSDSKIMIMGLSAATTGRLAVSLYSELESSAFYENVKKWHEETAEIRFSGKLKKSYIGSFSITEIAECAFGTEQGNFIKYSDDSKSGNILRLLPCVTEGRKIPEDIVRQLYFNASNPQKYEKSYNHRRVLETACGVIRRNEKGKDVCKLGYDSKETNRSYLYGCLLALADKAESATYGEADRDKRITNARRYWSAFSARPYTTWKVIEERLRPYLDKLGGGARVYYEKMFNEIIAKMNAEEFCDNSRLEPIYLLGYHHFTAYLYDNKKKNEEE